MNKTSINLFDYDLPPSSIAQVPIEPRDASRLLVLDRVSEQRSESDMYSPPLRGGVGGGLKDLPHFTSIITELRAGDVLVFNRSKVFKARLMIDGFEVFVLVVRDGDIDALVKGSKKLHAGSVLGDFEVMSKTDDGIVTFKTGLSSAAMFAFCDEHGVMPTPPYVTTKLEHDDRYQTVYATSTGSVAAPTAGLHFTPELIEAIAAKGVQIEYVTLHVGIGTFRPVQTEHIEDHTMHAEYVEIDAGTAARINAAKAEGRRVIAVGTTTVRVLEGVALRTLPLTKGETEGVGAFAGPINIFITPGFTFRIVDGLITNFHLPKSTLLVLVSAFAGRENVLRAYHHAIHAGYRFFSFGDAMFIR